MKSKRLIIEYDEYLPNEQLGEAQEKLIKAAEEAINSSYAPYSGFHVGASLKLNNGKIIVGSNQENSAYPSGLCAERVAIFSAKSMYPDSVIETIAITAKADSFIMEQPITPCGACRQVISETEKRQERKIRIIMTSPGSKTFVVNGIDNLLPFKFQEENLKKTK